MDKEYISQPEITVIIPVYNVEDYVSECLDSVLSQTVKNIEIVCIDDGSTDFSLGILRNYQRIDARIKIITQDNQGVFAARNNGLDVARGKYICFMDPDDWYPTIDVLETLLRAVKLNNVKIAGGSWSSFQNGNIKEEFTGNNAGYTMRVEGVVNYSDYQFDYGFQRFLYERDFLISNNIKFPAYRRYQDPVFFVKAMTLAGRFYSTKKIVYRYRESYKQIDWTEEKLCHLIRALTENFKYSSMNNLDVLHCRMYNRLVSYHIHILRKLLEINATTGRELFLKLNNSINVALVKKYHNEIDDNLPLPHLNQLLGYDLEQFDQVSPKVSVILPIYNVENYLRKSVDSVINQTLKDIEIILVDDGSPDSCPQIIEEYAVNDHRIKTIHKKNGGLSSARNSGMQVATGKYVYFLDSDDYISEDTLEVLYNTSEENKLDLIVFNADSFLDEEFTEDTILQKKADGYQDYYKRNGNYDGVMKGKDLFSKMHAKGEHRSAVWLQLIRREFYLLNNLFSYEGIIHEDNLYTLKAFLLAERAMFTPRYFFHRRVRANSIMTTPEGYKNFYGYFITYCESIKFISNCNYSISINKEIINEINVYKRHVIRIWKKLTLEEKSKFLSGLTIFQMNLWKTIEYEIESNSEIESKKASLKNANSKITATETALKNANSKITATETALKNANSKIAATETALKNANEKVKGIRDKTTKQLTQIKKENENLKHQIGSLRNSVSFKVGRFLTWAPRKIRGGVKCLSQHGFGYTIKRTIEHFGIDMGTGDFKK